MGMIKKFLKKETFFFARRLTLGINYAKIHTQLFDESKKKLLNPYSADKNINFWVRIPRGIAANVQKRKK